MIEDTIISASQLSIMINIPSSATRVFQGKFFEVFQWEQQLFDGTFTTFEKITRASTAQVIAITPEQKIIMTRQEQPLHDPFVALPGGVADPAETPLQAAQRELLEETGFEAQNWRELTQLNHGGRIDWTIHVFVAHQAKQVSQPNPDAGEKIRLEYLTFEEFIGLQFDPDFSEDGLALFLHRIAGPEQDWEKVRKMIFEKQES